MLHQLPPPEIPGWRPADWPSFVTQQRAQCAAEQRSLGLAGAWADQLAGFLAEVAPPSGPPVLLHTEIMSEHVLVTQSPGGDPAQVQLSAGLDAAAARPGRADSARAG